MGRSYLLVLGALSGLVSVLLHAVLWSLIDMVRPLSADDRAGAARVDFPDIALHVVSGIGLGLLFWLSWGLTAIVSVPWWQRGLMFGALTWGFTALPALISLMRARSGKKGATIAVALQWATTCLIAGLACAWSWAKTA